VKAATHWRHPGSGPAHRTCLGCRNTQLAGNSGIGLTATQASNCFGQDDENGIGLQATVAVGCHGRCYGNNFAISANIMNSCFYYRQTGSPAVEGNKYNMP
jgi:hypothetical protein